VTDMPAVKSIDRQLGTLLSLAVEGDGLRPIVETKKPFSHPTTNAVTRAWQRLRVLLRVKWLLVVDRQA